MVAEAPRSAIRPVRRLKADQQPGSRMRHTRSVLAMPAAAAAQSNAVCVSWQVAAPWLGLLWCHSHAAFLHGWPRRWETSLGGRGGGAAAALGKMDEKGSSVLPPSPLLAAGEVSGEHRKSPELWLVPSRVPCLAPSLTSGPRSAHGARPPAREHPGCSVAHSRTLQLAHTA